MTTKGMTNSEMNPEFAGEIQQVLPSTVSTSELAKTCVEFPVTGVQLWDYIIR